MTSTVAYVQFKMNLYINFDFGLTTEMDEYKQLNLIIETYRQTNTLPVLTVDEIKRIQNILQETAYISIEYMLDNDIQLVNVYTQNGKFRYLRWILDQILEYKIWPSSLPNYKEKVKTLLRKVSENEIKQLRDNIQNTIVKNASMVAISEVQKRKEEKLRLQEMVAF